eukprot:SAG31_NODE_1568_length_7858_cov_6.986854_5_plen_50_part_00
MDVPQSDIRVVYVGVRWLAVLASAQQSNQLPWNAAVGASSIATYDIKDP